MILKTKVEKWALNSIIYIIQSIIEYVLLSYNLLMPWKTRKTLQHLAKDDCYMLLSPTLFYLINIVASIFIIIIINPSALFHELTTFPGSSSYHASTIYLDLAKNMIEAIVEKRVIIWSNFIIEPLLCFLGVVIFILILQILTRYFDKTFFYYEHIYHAICYTSVIYILFASIPVNYINNEMHLIISRAIFYHNTYKGLFKIVFYYGLCLWSILLNNAFPIMLIVLNFIWGSLVYRYLAHCLIEEKIKLKRTFSFAVVIFVSLQVFFGFIPSLMKGYHYNTIQNSVQELDEKLMQAEPYFGGYMDYCIFANDDNLPNELRYTLMMRAALCLLSTGEDVQTKTIFQLCLDKLREKDYISIGIILKNNNQSVLKQDDVTKHLFQKLIDDMDEIVIIDKEHIFENWSFQRFSFNSNLTFKMFPFKYQDDGLENW